jgi:hypothetical protein
VQCEDQFRQEKQFGCPFFDFSSQLFISFPVFKIFLGKLGLKSHQFGVLYECSINTYLDFDPHNQSQRLPWLINNAPLRLFKFGGIGFVVLHTRPKTMKPGIKWHFTLVA